MEIVEWGIHNYGAKLILDPIAWPQCYDTAFIDVETDENDNFVGLGMCFNDKEVYYFTNLTTQGRHFLSKINLIGHNIKEDAKWLKKWGVDIYPKRLKDDTILMSYVVNTTKESHSLKELGKDLGYIWPTYKEIVGKGHNKLTLDKQSVELVSNYCAMDVFVTCKLYQHFIHKMDINQRTNYTQIELPLMKLLYQMELNGVRIDNKRLSELSSEFTNKYLLLENKILKEVEKAGYEEKDKKGKVKKFNPNSSTQKGAFLVSLGYSLPLTKTGKPSTAKGILQQFVGEYIIDIFLEYNKIKKLLEFLVAITELVKDDKIYPTYNQIRLDDKENEVGMSTSRLSCKSPNIQQIPKKGEEGNKLRELFIPSEGKVLLDPDYSQIEPRLTAHFSQDPFLLSVFREDKDLYTSLSEGTGRDRDYAKTFWLAKSYGAMTKKLANIWKCSIEEAEVIAKNIERKIPGYGAWKVRTIIEAHRNKGIYTLNRRFIPLPEINCADTFEQWYWERAAINYTIQGSAAEIMKKAMLELKKAGYMPLISVHDEILVEVDKDYLNKDFQPQHHLIVKHIMESVIKLSVPLKVEVGIGENWKVAKGE